MVIIRIKVYFT